MSLCIYTNRLQCQAACLQQFKTMFCLFLPNRCDDYFESSSLTHDYSTRHAVVDNYIAARFNKSNSQRLIEYTSFKF